MARIGRYAGSIIVEHDGKQILVGNPKEPCAVGDTLAPPYTLPLDGKLPLSGCALLVEHDDLAALAQLISDKLVIARNGSVSERLWRVVTNQQPSGELRAQWLIEIPQPVWNIVRDTMLKCS
ncbi:MAG TPA: precorrin-3B C(17)-methyltransferase [Polyangia bacterium]|nr:precorrin-3B C(17)-methyltransferase [Polyangia bacterium]